MQRRAAPAWRPREAPHAARVLDWIATAASGVAAWSVLLGFDVLQRVAILFGPRAHQRVAACMAHCLHHALRLSGARFTYEGLEHVTPGRAYIVVANHQSLFDISMSSDYLRGLQPRFVSKRELVRGLPGLSYQLRRGGSACLDGRDARLAVHELDRLARHLREDGWSIVIFPEGSRSKTGAMRPFQAAGLRALCAKAPGIPVLPVSISGGSRLVRRSMKPVVRGVRLSYRVHPPLLPPDPADLRAFGAFVREIEQAIRSGLAPEDAHAALAHGA